MSQRFYAHPTETFTSPNGAVGHRTFAGPFDCLGPYAKVRNCPVIVDGKEVARLTCYATGYADTHFSVPACTRYRGKYIAGYFTHQDGGISDPMNTGVVFRVMNRHADRMKSA